MFEEYAQFGWGHTHDLAQADVYLRDDVRGLKRPVVNGKETHLKAANNACLGCHDKPNTIGKKEAKKLPPIPLSHYATTKDKSKKQQRKLSGARFLCTQCHVPQAQLKPLVGNSF